MKKWTDFGWTEKINKDKKKIIHYFCVNNYHTFVFVDKCKKYHSHSHSHKHNILFWRQQALKPLGKLDRPIINYVNKNMDVQRRSP